MADSLIGMRGVCKNYDGAAAVSDINLSIAAGEFVAVMGPSGSGKTTLIKILAGFETPDSGDVLMHGKRINDSPPWRRNMPMVWQNLALFPFLNVRDNVEFGLKMRGVESAARRRRAEEWLDRLGILRFASRPVDALSGGQRQRVALARTLALEPEILLLDEPLSALDANLVLHMEDVLTELQKEIGIAFLYVTHSRQEAFAMADRVVVMDGGRIQQTGAPREVYESPKNRFVAGFVGNGNIFSGTVCEVSGGRARVRTAEGEFFTPLSSFSPQKDDAVSFVVPAAELEVATDGEGIPCIVRGEEFSAGVFLLHLRTESGTPLTAHLRASERREKMTGRTVRVRWSSEKAYLLPEGDGGQ